MHKNRVEVSSDLGQDANARCCRYFGAVLMAASMFSWLYLSIWLWLGKRDYYLELSQRYEGLQWDLATVLFNSFLLGGVIYVGTFAAGLMLSLKPTLIRLALSIVMIMFLIILNVFYFAGPLCYALLPSLEKYMQS